MAKTPLSNTRRNRPNDLKSTPEKQENDSKTSPETASEASKEALARLSIPLDADGLPAFDQMREATKSKLAKVLSDPATRKGLGLDSGPVDAGQQIPESFFLPLVGILSGLETMLIARATRAPVDIVARIAPYSRDEVAQLTPLLAKVANKHAGSYLSKWGEETMLLAMLAMMTTGKISAIREEMEKLRPAGTVSTFPRPIVTPPPSDIPTDLGPTNPGETETL